jgi:hypothetical protein
MGRSVGVCLAVQEKKVDLFASAPRRIPIKKTRKVSKMSQAADAKFGRPPERPRDENDPCSFKNSFSRIFFQSSHGSSFATRKRTDDLHSSVPSYHLKTFNTIKDGYMIHTNNVLQDRESIRAVLWI